ncbi:hypothetical protein IFM89_027210, partial [Coptis chinensis]
SDPHFFSLDAHMKGVNCGDYFTGRDRPYLITGSDDHTAKVWDYQTKSCVQTLEGHTHNVSAVCFHPELPIIITGSEDGTVRIWHATTYSITVSGNCFKFLFRYCLASLRKLDEQPEWLKGGKLRDYQLEGLNFLVNSWRNDTNVILADEMGLGKTVHSVSMLGFLQNAQQIHGPFLVVVPLSTLSNWEKEFKKWLPDLNVIVYIGNRASREVGNVLYGDIYG